MNAQNHQKAVFKDEGTQQMLNNPAQQTAFRDSRNQEFLDLILAKLESGDLNLYAPGSLMNIEVYETLNEELQGKVDLEAVNLLSAIRDIKGLYDSGNKTSYQMENMVERIRNTKERIESESGDVFVI